MSFPAKNRLMLAEKLYYPAAIILPFLIHAVARLLNPEINYLKWDNFEQLIPQIVEAHGQILNGDFPFWNWHQLLGDPLHAKLLGGTFYFPYTLTLLIIKLAGLSAEHFTTVLLLIHLPVISLGWLFLLNTMKASRLWGFLCAITACCAPFFIALSSVWIFTIPLWALFPWSLGLLFKAKDEEKSTWSMLAIFVLALGIYVGHVQLSAYYFLFYFLVIAAHIVLIDRRPGSMKKIGAIFFWVCLLSLPVILPTHELLNFSPLAAPFSHHAFVERGISWAALSGLLAPFFSAEDGFFNHSTVMLLYIGGWVPAVIALELLTVAFSLISRKKGALAPPVKAWLIVVSITVLFFVFALADNTPVYAATRFIPVWASFRWPFKFLYVALPAAILAAGLGGNILQGNRKLPVIGTIAIIPLLGAAGYFAVNWTNPGERQAIDYLLLAISCGMIMMVPLLTSASARYTLAALVIIAAPLLVSLGHDNKALKFKVFAEPYGRFGADYFGIDARYRVLPLSRLISDPMNPDTLQEQSLFHAATINGYESMTGHVTQMVPLWFGNNVPANIYGILPLEYAAALVKSDLLPELGVRYLLIARQDSQLLDYLNSTGRYKLVRTPGNMAVFEHSSPVLGPWFAEYTLPATEKDFFIRLLANKVPPRTAFVATSATSDKLPPAEVISFAKGANRISIDVAAPAGGLLVIPNLYYPGWQAKINGRSSAIIPVNGFLQGVNVPPGTRKIEVIYQNNRLYLGIMVNVCAAVAYGLWLLYRKRAAAGKVQPDHNGSLPAE